MVFPKWVPWVWVQFWILAHHVPILWCCGYTQVKYRSEVKPFFSNFPNFLSHFLFDETTFKWSFKLH